MVKFVLLQVVLAALCSVAVHGLNVNLYGVNYVTRQGPDWDPKKCKTQSQIEEDFKTISTITNRVRIYSLTDCNQGGSVLAAAKKANLQVWLGIWVGKDEMLFDAEYAELSKLVAANAIGPNVVGIHVGSETVYRKEISPDKAISYLKKVKTFLVGKGINIPVSIADIADTYLAYPQMVAAVDIVCANAFPFWEKADVATSMTNMATKLDPLVRLAGTKEVIISETGWSSGGKNEKSSIASPENSAQYFGLFYNFAKKRNLKYYYFAALDDDWKSHQEGSADTVEANFGIFKADRTMKPYFSVLNITSSSGSGSDAGSVKFVGTVPPSSTSTPQVKRGSNSRATTTAISSFAMLLSMFVLGNLFC